MAENNLSSISQADTLEKMGEFWDTHDFTEFDTDVPDIECIIDDAIAESSGYKYRSQVFVRLKGQTYDF